MNKYQRNNIIFRIASADAIGAFKKAQAHSFVQLSRKEINFDESAKEVILLEYDRYSQWIMKVEKYFLTNSNHHTASVPESLLCTLVDSFNDELKLIEDVISKHVDVFSNDVFEFVKMVHTCIKTVMQDKFSTLVSLDICSAVILIIESVSDYLQHLLVSLHEFNNNLITKDQPIFICVTDFSIGSTLEKNDFNECKQSAWFFKNHGLGQSFVFKNYSSLDVFDTARTYLSKFNINLIPEQTTMGLNSIFP
jgi:hypothetical protein